MQLDTVDKKTAGDADEEDVEAEGDACPEMNLEKRAAKKDSLRTSPPAPKIVHLRVRIPELAAARKR